MKLKMKVIKLKLLLSKRMKIISLNQIIQQLENYIKKSLQKSTFLQ